MAFRERSVQGGEKVFYTARPTRLAHLHVYVFGVLLMLAAAFLWLLRPGPLGTPILFTSLATIVAWIIGFIGFVIIMRWEFRRLTTKYTFTDMRVIKVRGILRRRTEYAMLNKIERIEVDQGIIARLLGIGDIILDTGDMDAVILFGIRDVRNVEAGIAKSLALHRPQ